MEAGGLLDAGPRLDAGSLSDDGGLSEARPLSETPPRLEGGGTLIGLRGEAAESLSIEFFSRESDPPRTSG
jgi:hypothetical protein